VAFELGATLRQAREARQLAFEEVAAATRIHPRHLAALEAERFDSLPGRAYARSFLHEYAHYLGLDASVFVSEYDLRYCDTRVAPHPLVAVDRRRAAHTFRGGFVLGVALIAVVVGVVAWKFGGPSSHPARVASSLTPQTPPAVVTPKPTTPAPAPVVAAPKLIAVKASARCWLLVRSGSATGAVVYEGILQAGETKQFAQRPLWIRFGAPWSASVQLDGKAVALPQSTGPLNMLFTSTAQPA